MMYPSIRTFGLVLSLTLPAIGSAQWTLPNSGCSIRYDHDAAGNRTSRYWYCWTDGDLASEGMTEFPDSTGLQGSIAQNVDHRVLEPLELDLFPNPASDGVTIILSRPADNVTYDIYDSQGRSVLHGRMQGGRLDVPTTSIPSGLYNICLIREHEMLVRPFVVEH